MSVWMWCYKHPERPPAKLTKAEFEAMVSAAAQTIGPSKTDHLVVVVNCDGQMPEEDVQAIAKHVGSMGAESWDSIKLKMLRSGSVEELLEGGEDETGSSNGDPQD